MKVNVRFVKYQVIERIKRIKNNRFILMLIVVTFLLIVLIPLFFVVFNADPNKYQGIVKHSLQERFQADTISCVENITEKDSVSCRRGPVVIAATDEIARKVLKYNKTSSLVTQKIKLSDLNNATSEAKFFRFNWGILPDLVNWFYNNVPWGPEILTFDKIILTWANPPNWLPNYSLKGAAYGKHWGKKNSGVRIFLKSLLSGAEKEIDDNNKNLVLKKLNNLKYYLFNTYINFKSSWYVNDETSPYFYGSGVEANVYREKINQKVINDYISRRFKNINSNNQPLKVNVYNKKTAYQYLAHHVPKLKMGAEQDNLSYRDLFVLANTIYKLTATSSFAVKDFERTWIFDGIDEFGNVGNEVTWFQLNNNELLQQFKNVEIFINHDQKCKIANLTKKQLETTIKSKNIADIINFEVDFNGYSPAWIQQYFSVLVVPILLTQKIDTIKDFVLENNYQKIIDQYEKPSWMPPLIKPKQLNVADFNKEEQLKIGLLNENSPINYVNKMRAFISRDWEILNFNQTFIENNAVTNDTSLILKDIALLNNLGANPYQTKAKISEDIAIDPGTVTSLQKLLRMDEDVAMGHLSAYSELSFIWGYMNQEDNYDYLKLTDRAGNNKLIKITTQNDLDTNYNCHHNVDCNINDQHSLISNEFINTEEFNSKLIKPNKKLLSNVINKELGLKTARKLWITDYALLADYSNAIAKAGDYKVSFFNSKLKNEKPLIVSEKNKEYVAITNDSQHILNSNGNSMAFAGWWFYTRYGSDKELFFRVAEQSWINK